MGGSSPIDQRPVEAWLGGHVLLSGRLRHGTGAMSYSGQRAFKSAFTPFRAEAFTVKVVLPVHLSSSTRDPRPGLLQLSSISKLFPDSVTPDVIRVDSNLEL